MARENLWTMPKQSDAQEEEEGPSIGKTNKNPSFRGYGFKRKNQQKLYFRGLI